MKKVRKSNLNLLNLTKINEIETSMKYHYVEIMSQMDLLKKSDSQDKLRQKYRKETSEVIQQAIHKHQNPNNCQRLLLCEGKMNSKKVQICGWGCMIHQKE